MLQKIICEPRLVYSIDFIELYGREVVVASIPESDNKPHRLQDYENEFDINKAVVIVRVNDKSVAGKQRDGENTSGKLCESCFEEISDWSN